MSQRSEVSRIALWRWNQKCDSVSECQCHLLSCQTLVWTAKNKYIQRKTSMHMYLEDFRNILRKVRHFLMRRSWEMFCLISNTWRKAHRIPRPPTDCQSKRVNTRKCCWSEIWLCFWWSQLWKSGNSLVHCL